MFDTKRSNDGICLSFQTTHLQTFVDAVAGSYRTCNICKSLGGHTMLPSRPSGRMRVVEVSQKTRGPRALLSLQCEYPFAGRMLSAAGSSREVDVHSPNKHRARRRSTCVARAHSITLSVKKKPAISINTAHTSNLYLSRACFSHQCRQFSGSYITRDIVEQLPHFSP